MTTKDISIRSVFIVVTLVFTVATAVSVSSIVFSNWFSSARSISRKMALGMNTTIFEKIDSYLRVPLYMNEVHHGMIENGLVDMENETERERFFVGVLHAQTEYVYSFSYGAETGEYYGARRNASGDVEIMRNDALTGGESWYYSVTADMAAGDRVVRAGKFDPRTRDWYRAAKAADAPVFSPVYRHFIMPDLAVSAAYPIRDRNGHLRGVLGTHITLSKIDGFLKEIVRHEGAFAVIAERNSGAFIANSRGMDNFDILPDNRIVRTTLRDAGNDILKTAFELDPNGGNSVPLLSGKDGDFFVSLKRYENNGLDWIILSAIPERLLGSNIVNNIRITILLVFLCLLAFIAFLLGISRVLLKPIDRLIETTERFAGGDLSERVPIRREDEIGRISRSFNGMADTISTLVAGLGETVAERTAQLREANDALNESHDRLRLILDSAAEGIYGIDTNHGCTFCNASCLRMLGYENESDLIGRDMHDTIHHSRRDGSPFPAGACRISRTLPSGGGVHADDEVFWRADGTCFDVEYFSYPQYRDGAVVGAVVTFLDNTERRRNEARVSYLGSHDVLTGLCNRMGFEDALRRIDAERNLPITIIFGDVNGLKLTNDIFGHAVGDALLRKSAEILKRVSRDDDVVSRVGGDEFAILLAKTGEDGARKIVERIRREFAKEKIVAIKASISIGFDTKTDIRQSIEGTLKNAEDAMYREKTLDRKAVASDMIGTIVETLHARNPGEREHAVRVSDLCREMGAAMGMPETEVRRLRETGFLHDIGKIVLGENLLRKRYPLTEEERREFQQHPAVGFRILNLFDDTLDLADGVLNHHENWDGSGYPRGIRGEEIPLSARIVRIAESFISLTDEEGEHPLSAEEALRKIGNGAGTLFDPAIADVFARLIPGGTPTPSVDSPRA